MMTWTRLLYFIQSNWQVDSFQKITIYIWPFRQTGMWNLYDKICFIFLYIEKLANEKRK